MLVVTDMWSDIEIQEKFHIYKYKHRNSDNESLTCTVCLARWHFSSMLLWKMELCMFCFLPVGFTVFEFCFQPRNEVQFDLEVFTITMISKYGG